MRYRFARRRRFPEGRMYLAALLLLILSLPAALPATAAEPRPVVPSAQDKCPVCGMFVAKYPDWVAEIVFADGSHALFDGPKDMLRFFLDMKKYGSDKSAAEVSAVYVKEYYDLDFIDGLKALYVFGSDVYGPMGKELVPFAKADDAAEFRKDHQGDKVLRFEEITPALMQSLN